MSMEIKSVFSLDPSPSEFQSFEEVYDVLLRLSDFLISRNVANIENRDTTFRIEEIAEMRQKLSALFEPDDENWIVNYLDD